MIKVLPKFRTGYAEPFGTGLIAAALPMPLLLVGPKQDIVFVNPAAEQFFDTGAGILLKQTLVPGVKKSEQPPAPPKRKTEEPAAPVPKKREEGVIYFP